MFIKTLNYFDLTNRASCFQYLIVRVQSNKSRVFSCYLHVVVRGRDPSAVAVLVEDGAAVAGLLIAASCLGLTSYTGNVVYDAVGSIAIGGTDSIHMTE